MERRPEANRELSGETGNGLQMAPELMLELAHKAAGHPERATVYMSDQSHSAHIRAARIIGVRPECIRLIPSDDLFRLDMDALVQAVADDRAAGFNPIAVCANAGTSSTGTIDPIEAMADHCEAEGIWLHVDAAYGGFAVVTEQGKELLCGIERSDSIGLDAHKWFFTFAWEVFTPAMHRQPHHDMGRCARDP